MSELKSFLNQHRGLLLPEELWKVDESCLFTRCRAISVNTACGSEMVICDLSIHIHFQQSSEDLPTNGSIPVSAKSYLQISVRSCWGENGVRAIWALALGAQEVACSWFFALSIWGNPMASFPWKTVPNQKRGVRLWEKQKLIRGPKQSVSQVFCFS